MSEAAGDPSSARGHRARSCALALLLALGAGALLGWHTVLLRKDRLWTMEWRIDDAGGRVSMATWRYWDDTGLAIARYLDWRHGRLPGGGDPGPLIDGNRERLERQTRAAEIKPHQFWRTVDARPFLRARRPYSLPRFEDRGRSRLVAVGFVALAGIAPYLTLWIGTLFCLPLLVWVALELAAGGRGVAGLLFVLVLALSPYVVESLSLPHSAVGFYLAGALVLVALAAYVFLRPRVTHAGLVARMSVAAVLFAVCVSCRSGALLFAPAFLLVLACGHRRREGGGPGAQGPATSHRRRRAVGPAVLGLAFLLPSLLLAAGPRHNTWSSLWEGLGDFGADRGYSWHDRDMKRVMEREGITAFAHPREVDQTHERLFRGIVLRDVTHHPVWYAGILGRRLAETVGLRRLLPWGPWDGASLDPPEFHYKYTTTAEWFGLGDRRWEAPISLLALPTAALGGLWLARRRGRGSAAGARGLEAEGSVLLCLALATLPLPVLVTTAAGIETEAFVLVYLLGLALLAEHGARACFAGLRRMMRR